MSTLSRDEALTEMITALTALRGRIRWRDGVYFATRWAWVAAGGALLIQLLSFVTPLENAWFYSLAVIVLAAVGWLAWTLARPLPLERVARMVDAEARTKERLATALYLDATARRDELATTQQLDAAGTAQRAAGEPAQTLAWKWAREPLIAAGVMLLATVILPFVPNPMDGILAEREAVRQEAEAQADEIEELIEELEQNQAIADPEREALIAELEALEEELRENPGDKAEALAAIEAARAALEEQLDPNTPGREASLEQIAEAIERLSGENQNEGLGGMAEALQALAANMGDMSAEERQAAAEELRRQAAQAAATDPELAQALQALAGALESGNQAAAQAAAAQAAQAVAAAQADISDQEAIAGALDQLEESRGEIAQAQPGQQGQQGQGQGQGEGQGQGQGQGQGHKDKDKARARGKDKGRVPAEPAVARLLPPMEAAARAMAVHSRAATPTRRTTAVWKATLTSPAGKKSSYRNGATRA